MTITKGRTSTLPRDQRPKILNHRVRCAAEKARHSRCNATVPVQKGSLFAALHIVGDGDEWCHSDFLAFAGQDIYQFIVFRFGDVQVRIVLDPVHHER